MIESIDTGKHSDCSGTSVLLREDNEMTDGVRLSVLQVGSHLWPECGGIYKTAKNFSAALISKGHTIETISFDQTDGTDDSVICHYRVSQLPGLNYVDYTPLVFNPMMKQRIEQSDCVIVHGFYSFSINMLIRHARTRGIPIVMVPNGGLDPWVFSYRAWRKRLWLRLFRKELFLAPSAVIFATEQEKIKARKLIDSETSVVINWPVDPQNTFDKSHAESKLRARFQIPREARILLYCGRIHPMKCPIETAEAFLAAETRDWVLMFVGPFSREISEAKLRAACGNSKNKFIIAGPQFGQDLVDCYQGATAFVSLSHRENFGYTVAEAASYGLPVLVTGGVDLSPDIQCHGAGLVCVGNSQTAFTRAISDLCRLSDERLRGMGNRGRLWADQDLSPLTFASKLDAVIKKVTNCNHSRQWNEPSLDRR